jgi:hypothetical protein
MEMLWMGLCLSIFCLAVGAVAFGAATRSEAADSTVQPQLPLMKPVATTRFFSDAGTTRPAIVAPQVPLEILLRQIENHVRLEQAAAESFVAFPTQTQLHTKTSSPFVN